jgi:hypothetical protein
MLNVLKGIVARNAKAIAAYFTTLIVGLLVSVFGEAPADVSLAVQSMIVAFIVWLTANRE